MSTIVYIPRSLQSEVASLPVLCIYASCYEKEAVKRDNVDTGKYTNHWVFFCAITQSSSVRIDPSPSNPNSSVALGITKKASLISTNSIKSMRIVTDGLTVGGFIDLLTERTYDKYQFTQDGQGCRYWVYSVLQLLKTQDRTRDAAEVEAAMRALQIVWDDNGEELPQEQQTAIQQGRFYALPQA